MTPIAVMLAAVCAGTGETYREGSLPVNYWRSPLRCGPNCLYAYLSIHGHPASLRAISERVPIGAAGANMADLSRVATDLCVPSRVVRSTPGQLNSFPLPTIAHLRSRDGHFVLVLRVTHDTVTTADMLSGNVETLPAELFFARWSGYLIVPGKTNRVSVWLLMAAGAVAVASFAALRLRRPHRRCEVG